MLIATALTATLAMTASTILVTPEEVPALDNAQIVDVRPAEDYHDARIPGALVVDVDALSAPKEGGVVNVLRPVEEVASDLYQSGLDPEKATVIYGAFAEPSDMLNTARLFWILEALGWEDVHVLDGGFPRWLAEERETASGPAPEVTPPANPPAAKLVRQRLATKEDVQRIHEEGGARLVDARGAAYYDGTEQSDSVQRAGRIPGSVNLPASDFVNFEGLSFLAQTDIEERLAEGGVDKDTPTVTYCNTGRSASVAYLAARIAGIENVAMYDGSMTEWAADESCEVETGSE